MAQQMVTDGLVIRDFHIGEADRILTILTRKLGVIRASARGARRMKNSLSSATQLLCHSDFTLYKGREKYIIDEAEPLDLFMGVRSDLEKLALAQYFCELEETLAPREESGEETELALRLALNALSFLETKRHLPLQIKAVFEMRLLANAGYMPDLIACAHCGVYEDDTMFLLPQTGTLLCSRCAPEHTLEKRIPLSRSVLAAMRHAVYADFNRMFSFSLPEPALKRLSESCEAYLLYTLDRSFPTLEFYHSLSGKKD